MILLAAEWQPLSRGTPRALTYSLGSVLIAYLRKPRWQPARDKLAGPVVQGAALTVLERYEDAETAFAEAIALDPESPQLQEALKDIRDAFGADPSFTPTPSSSSSRPSR